MRRENSAKKPHNFDLAKSHVNPPEGYSCANLLAVEAQGDDTKKYFYVHGGAGRTEEATWFSASDLYDVETECDDLGHVDMTSLTKATVSLSLIVMSANDLKVILIKLKLPDTVYLFFSCGDRFRVRFLIPFNFSDN